MGELLFEIGTEEIPSNYLDQGIEQMHHLFETYLEENRLDPAGEIHCYGTPRRLTLIVYGLVEKQKDIVQEITGPPKKISFDDQGNPTKAAQGFAEKQGMAVEDLRIIETPKGEYLFVEQKIKGRFAGEVLAEILPKIAENLSWPKSMRWGEVGFGFVRPIQWVLALLDGQVLDFELAGLKSGNQTRGHRFMAPGNIKVAGVAEYIDKLKQSFVILDPKERVEEVERLVIEAGRELEGSPMDDPELLSTVSNLVEYPSAVHGSFDNRFLKIPDPVLITAMKKHQKYFAIMDEQERLKPFFIAVNNTRARDEKVVAKGHERVLRARLADAEFFFNEDRKKPLLDRLEDLKEVIYQADLGSSYAKVQRFTRLSEYLVRQVSPDGLNDVRLAASLCKCDLVTEMVMEFPELQGIMGREYALLDGYADNICQAVLEHYLPTGAGGDLPESILGAVIGLADRMDTITGCFAVGLEPTGDADPFALRRHALAIIRILEQKKWPLSLKDFISESIGILADEVQFDRDEIFGKVYEFFRERYKQLILRAGYKSDLIEAIISVNFNLIPMIRPRIDQLKGFSTEADEFESLVLTNKRIANILKNQDETTAVETDLFQHDCESTLWNAYQGLKEVIREKLDSGQYVEALTLTMQLRKPVDDFFDSVEVLTKKDPALMKNRIGILRNLSGLFLSLADFSKFSI